jgi:dolichyl-phosphate beta-glucosyltransferase
MPPSAPVWSVVIPAFNEEDRLPRYLGAVIGYFDGRGEPYEVIVVDDGSSDGTAAAVLDAGRQHRAVRLVRLPVNRGKGAAVRAGMLAARGAFRLFADADGATPIVELGRLEGAVRKGADVAIASRALGDPSVTVRARPHRRWAGQLFNRLVALAGLPGVADSQCGFKCFRARAAEDLFGALRTEGFGFDVELLLRARRRGYRVVEVPVNWADQPGSKVGLLTHGLGMVWQVVQARRRVARS